jgi:hypothetical protein
MCVALTALALTTFAAPAARAAEDVLLQTMNSRIVVGSVDDQTFSRTLGVRVHSGAFNSSFLTADPGFLSFAHGNFNLPPDAEGFPALHDVNFDLLPMAVGQTSANLLYWSGADTGANGLTTADVSFAPPVGIHWQVLNGSSAWITADATSSFVPGGLIQRTTSDIDPDDGVNSGAMHKHLALRVIDAGLGSPPPQGIYMVAWQIRSAGFETSDPLLILHRTSGASAAALSTAIAWAEANFDANSQVDGNDFLAWQRNLGTSAATDLASWRDVMTTGSATVTTVAVPEPTTEMITVATIVVTAFVSRFRIR